MHKIVGGLDLNEVTAGGVVFDLESVPPTEPLDTDGAVEQEEYLKIIKDFTKLECIGLGMEDEDVSGAGEPFSALSNKMYNLRQDGKIKKRIIREGYGEKPSESSRVKINYNGYIQFEATPFDSTFGRKEPYQFNVGQGETIEGIDIAVRSMKMNEKAEFLIEPELAYKDGGLKRIPPNSTVLFEIEMCDIFKTNVESPENTEKDFSDTYKYCSALCAKGKHLFKKQDYSGAVKEYQVAVGKMENALLNDYADQIKSDQLLLKLYTNLVICFTHLQLPKCGCFNANKIYDFVRANENVKASAQVYYNNAKCLRMLGDYRLAFKRLKIADNLKPEDPDIAQEFVLLKQALNKEKNRERAFGQALLNN